MGVTAGQPARVLVTGAAGFLGAHLTRQLVSEGHEVIALLRPADDRSRIVDLLPQLRVVEGDLSSLTALEGTLREARPEICVHLAWQGWKGSAQDNLASLSASVNLLRLMPSLQCERFLSAGTCYEYDLCDGRLSESSPLKAREVYGACKSSLYEVGQLFGAETGITVSAARIFYTYGPGEPASGLVPYIIRSLMNGEPAALTPGEQVRDYVRAEDIASAIWAVARSGVKGAVNIASGEPVTVADIARRIGDLVGRPDLIRLGAIEYRGSEPMRVLGDATRLRTEVHWSPRFNINTGLADYVSHWKERAHV